MKQCKKTIYLALFILVHATNGFAQDFGSFDGKVVTEWLDDGRKMKLLEPFAYIAPNGSRWDAPKGWIVDGASIPRVAWTLIGGPYEGAYRNASVIHDVACDQKQRPWRDVHKAFYTAMLAAQVDPIKAKVMYAAVYHFGPRWERQVTFAKVPIQEVESKIAKLRISMAPGESLETKVVPIPRRGCPPGIVCNIAVNLPPTDAKIIAQFQPEPSNTNAVSTEDFEKLRSFVEETDPPLDAIEHYQQ
ncbi:DUF1353 domain-containing protein [Jeongeupia naejangsanensis]|uniref:DUF1353 domain-containing protein n=1 Tax=Jeongeupia naejangsanensis TaxID=613195 RepID=A0ABS2BH87_9NEIS|nr:DUF1353 domain-containing protein [Jeongeupia naejangsanensis]MBM3114977.1 DUF1353 domain-containing protein [Jeongeupia naejangsanensis]